MTMRMMAACVVAVAVAASLAAIQNLPDLTGADAPANGVWLDTLDYAGAYVGRSIRPGKSTRNTPIAVAGAAYQHGLGVTSNTELWYDLGGAATRLQAVGAIDDARKTGQGSVTFEVWLDGKLAFTSGPVKSGEPGKPIDVDLTGARQMVLVTGDAGDSNRDDDADWAGAVVVATAGGQQPKPIPPVDEPPPHLASSVTTIPRINAPRVVGATPGRPFLFLIPATGDAPLTFNATGLPDGLSLDAKTGIISGSIAEPGTTKVQLRMHSARGTATHELTIVGASGKLALTPPMGWNSWNVWAGAVNAEKVRAAADDMVKSGLAAHGYQYINIDDTWEAGRDANGEIQTNDKFGDMKALADYVHAKGLKLGIYSSPGPKTCARFEGSYQHEAQDAATYAKWGIDYLKYDWCSYRDVVGNTPTLEQMKAPYKLMRGALDKVDRDIVFSLCQYGMGNVWEWGDEVGGNLWRTTGDITDTWQSLAGIGFNQAGHEKYAAPGRWNDPDMLVVGKLGWGPNVHPTRLTPNEQMTHITLWSLVASPLLIGADMSALDKFTTDLLGNDEVLAVNQDPAAKTAGRVSRDGALEVWARSLSDGSTAVGLFNRSPFAASVTAKWSDVGLSGSLPVRDLWQHKDLGKFADAFTTTVPRHGAVMVKIGK
jgi:alpha-galactosidase